MEDPAVVRGLERSGDLPADADGLVERKRARGDPLRERFPRDQLEHEAR